MKFRTEIEVTPFEKKIDYNSQILSIGSCCAQEVVSKLEEMRFRTTINPTGTLFNPASIYFTLLRFAEKRLLKDSELHHHQDIYFSYDFHSSLNGVNACEVLENINNVISESHERLAKTDWVIITFGTAWVYILNESGQIVANCQKQPASNFTRRRLSVEEIVEMYDELMRGVLADKQVIFTVSPVRHLSDGADENFLSKATLKVAVAEIVEKFDNAHYFPAYEILNDDLRDYRFYADDMVHPSHQAISYIHDKFVNAVISEQAQKLLSQIDKIRKACHHRPLNENSTTYLEFCQQQLEKINQLADVNLEYERAHFEMEIDMWHQRAENSIIF